MPSLRYSSFSLIFIAVLTLGACKDDPIPVDPGCAELEADLVEISYDPQAVTLAFPAFFPRMPIPSDNPLTADGIQLGRKLFYDTRLSADGTQSCASCHLQNAGFTDNLAVSTGIDGVAGHRSSMSILNLGFVTTGLFWDGRSATLEEQALLPVEDPIELHHSWQEVIADFQVDPGYQLAFRKAFGIERSCEINKELAAKAIAQFERSIVSLGNSKYDRRIRGDLGVFFTDSEERGRKMFFDDGPNLPDAECGHCHNAPLFTTNEFLQNGLQEAATLEDFRDKGLGAITGKPFDNGKFRAPTLRNIELSAPYMHDGRFQTLEEVIDHYNSGGKTSPNPDPLMRPLGLTEDQKVDLLNFLKTLTDTTFVSYEPYSNPF